MEKREEAEILSLIDQIPELKSLYAEHQDLEKQLDKLNHKHYLTPEEEMERKRIQKVKLVGKDRMMAILAGHRGEAVKSAQGGAPR
jgi:uncharacterized protein YdcH (DUF465 family)